MAEILRSSLVWLTDPTLDFAMGHKKMDEKAVARIKAARGDKVRPQATAQPYWAVLLCGIKLQDSDADGQQDDFSKRAASAAKQNKDTVKSSKHGGGSNSGGGGSSSSGGGQSSKK